MARKKPLKESLTMILGALALLAAYVWAVRPYMEKKKEREDKSQILFASATRDNIHELIITRGNEDSHLKKSAANNSRWTISKNEKTFECDSGIMDGFFSTLLGAKLEKKLENVPELSTLGLAEPKFKLAVHGDGLSESKVLLMGDDTPVDYFTYAKWSDSPEVILVSRSLRFALDKAFNDWRNRKVLNIHPDTLSKLDIKVSRLDKHPNTFLSFTQDDHGWKSGNIVLDNTEVKTFLEKLSSIQVANFASEDPKDKNKFGFNNPVASFVLTSKDTATQPVRWVLSSSTDAKSKETKYYLMNQQGDESYEVPEVMRDYFRVDLMKFRPKKFYFPSPGGIYGLKIQSDKESVRLIKKDKQWMVKGGEESDDALVPAKGPEVEKLIQSLNDAEIKEYFDGQTPYMLGLQNPARIMEASNMVDGKEVVVATLFFGKKKDTPGATLRAEGMSAAGRIDFNIDQSLNPSKTFWAQNPAPVPTPIPAAPEKAQNATSSQNSLENKAEAVEKKKMKLEPTVKSISELKKLPGPIVKKGFKYTAEITMSNGKKIVITFAPDKAPYTVSNFLHLARNGFYNNVSFHRVIAKFVAQGGDPTGRGSGGPGWMFDNEDNDLKHLKGSISMAHAGRNTNGSQFFLVLEPQPHLDGVHTVFGSVTQGMDVVESIKAGDVMKTVEVFEEAL